jgi:hypothetical protein
MILPIILHEIDIKKPDYFMFQMPAVHAGGHGDIEISVEYSKAPDDPDILVYNAWARKGDASVKHFIYTSRIPVSSNAVESIMEDINGSYDYDDQLRHFIKSIEK